MNRTIPVFYSDAFLAHETSSGRGSGTITYYHPEKPGRLTAIVNQLKSELWANQIDWRSPTPVNDNNPRLTQALLAVHPADYVKAVHRLADAGGGYLDPDTPISARSFDVALLAVSAWLDGVDYALTTGEPTFVAARPPGHHALPTHSMGFCIFSNAAIAALYALKQPGVNRVAILDWDVHHGNGTQAIVETNPQIAFCSLHQFPYYPGTGRAEEHGIADNVRNFPMAAGSSMADYQPLFEQEIVPFLQQFQPDLLIVSAGYDANKADPLAGIALQPQDYGRFTDYCLSVTRKIVFGLEGGYDFKSLGQSVAATIERCLR
jgi:acetoin utilization deacetylase AcuC-like enzyme